MRARDLNTDPERVAVPEHVCAGAHPPSAGHASPGRPLSEGPGPGSYPTAEEVRRVLIAIEALARHGFDYAGQPFDGGHYRAAKPLQDVRDLIARLA